jgi:hypothetical protein
VDESSGARTARSSGLEGRQKSAQELAIKSLLFVGQEGDVEKAIELILDGKALAATELQTGPGWLYVFDKKTCETVAEVRIPGHVTGAMMTYVAGKKQYLVFPVGGLFTRDELIALSSRLNAPVRSVGVRLRVRWRVGEPLRDGVLLVTIRAACLSKQLIAIRTTGARCKRVKARATLIAHPQFADQGCDTTRRADGILAARSTE